MSTDFVDYFWGEKNNGFDVLYHNMKYGAVASKELAEFLRERSNIEETNSKLLLKLAKQASSACPHGTFAPFWGIFRSSAEKLSSIHAQMVQSISDIVKDINKYSEELHRKHKQVKEAEAGTLDIVQAIQATTVVVQKARDVLMQKVFEYDKLRRESASPKDLEKLEAKLKRGQEEYKILVEKYRNMKVDFENKMEFACKHFQEVEAAHVTHMKNILDTYAQLLLKNHNEIGQVHIDFKKQCSEMTVDRLLEVFVRNKSTGLEKPEQVECGLQEVGAMMTRHQLTFEPSARIVLDEKPSKKEGNHESGGEKTKPSRRTTSLLNLFMPNSQGSKTSSGNVEGGSLPTSAPTSPTGGPGLGAPSDGQATTTLARNPLRGSKWFLRSRRDKRKEKKTKKKTDNSDNVSNKEDKSEGDDKEEQVKSDTPTPEVDDDGYSIKPKQNVWEMAKENFYSSSDTDSEDERERKIRVEIKPLTNASAPISASVDELRATMENISLSSAANTSYRRSSTTDSEQHMKRSQSVSQHLGGPSASSASTPTGGSHPYAPLQSPPQSQSVSHSPAPTSSSRYADLGDLFTEVGDIQPTLPPKPWRSTPTPTQSVRPLTPTDGQILWSIPRPPSAQGQSGRTGAQQSPLTPPPHAPPPPPASPQTQTPPPISSPSQMSDSLSNSSVLQDALVARTGTPTEFSVFAKPCIGSDGKTRVMPFDGTIASRLDSQTESSPMTRSVTPTDVIVSAKSGLPIDTKMFARSTTPTDSIFSRTLPRPPTPTDVTLARIIPRPPSKRGEAGASRGRMSPATIARADSVGSLEFRSAGVSTSSSRGPSPLTIGMADTIPVAVAFHELIHTYFKGTDESRCLVRMSGDMMMSFPSGIITVLANNPNPAPLLFRIRNTDHLEVITPNEPIVSKDASQSSSNSCVFEFNMTALTTHLRWQAEKNPAASYYNVEVLKYKVKPKKGAGSCPFQLVAYWKCEPTRTSLRIDYKYNSHAMAAPSPLLNVVVSAPVEGGFVSLQANPIAEWSPENERVVWKLTELSQYTENHGVGSLRARVEVLLGPSSQGTVAVQFNCEGTTLSGVEFELIGQGYRISLAKRRFVSGKYICDGDPLPYTG
ncbi:F-BAR domain only protein 2-like isoform X2 [Bacillus rossius redtenbacheri]|uniref:F-BAR domain only protein 2-like isoform X2 n=1 Tax=Bacillus rossius redtenbacheri TaxID=93214 RepID=UPI002FDCC9A5